MEKKLEHFREENCLLQRSVGEGREKSVYYVSDNAA
jgi:hypothetical protein